MWVTDFSDCSHPAARSSPVLYSHRINLDKQDGAFDIYSGGDLKTISPGDYITCQSSLCKTENFPHILGWGRRGQVTAACPPSLNVYFSTGSFSNMNFHSNQQQLKPVRKKSHPHSFFFALGKVQNCKKSEKYCTSV